MQRYIDSIQDKFGTAIAGAQIYVRTTGGALAELFSDNGSTALANPLRSDFLGGFSFYAKDGRYNLEIRLSGIQFASKNDILLEDPADANPANIDGGTVKNVSLEKVTLDADSKGSDNRAVPTKTEVDALADLISEDGESIVEIRARTDKALLPFDTLAEATAAAATLPDYQPVDALDVQKRYRVEAGALVFVANLDQLKIDLTDPAKGGSEVALQPLGAGAIPTNVQEFARRSNDVLNFVSVSERAAIVSRTSTYDASAALEKAWEAAPPFSTLNITGKLRLASPVVLSNKPVNIDCHGDLEVVFNGTDWPIKFNNAPEIVLPGTALTSLNRGDKSLAFVAPPSFDSSEYFVEFWSTEVLIVRLGAAGILPYMKHEIHGFADGNWLLTSPVLYDHDLTKVEIRFIKRSQRTTINNLRITTVAGPHTSNTLLIGFLYRSGITFNNLSIDGRITNGPGEGLGVSHCYDFEYNSPVIKGYNSSAGDSYPTSGFLSGNIRFNNVVDQSTKDPSGNKRSRFWVARHCDHIYFDGLVTPGMDDHYGSNYYLRNAEFTGGGFGFAGENVTMENVKGVGAALFSIRQDTPMCRGKLKMTNVEVGPSTYLAYCTAPATDPTGKVSDYRAFDEIEIDGVKIQAGAQVLDSFVKFQAGATVNTTKTARVSIKNVENYATPGNSVYNFLSFSGVNLGAVLVSRYTRHDNSVPISGDVRFWGTGSLIDEVIVDDSKDITFSNMNGVAEFKSFRSKIGGAGAGFSITENPGKVTTYSFHGTRIDKEITTSGATVSGTRIELLQNSIGALNANTRFFVRRGIDNVVDTTVPVSFEWAMFLYDYTDGAYYKGGALFKTHSVNPPSISVGAIYPVTVDVPGAMVGMQASAAFMLADSGLLCTATVSAPDVVTVFMQNVSAAAKDYGGGFLRVRVVPV